MEKREKEMDNKVLEKPTYEIKGVKNTIFLRSSTIQDKFTLNLLLFTTF